MDSVREINDTVNDVISSWAALQEKIGGEDELAKKPSPAMRMIVKALSEDRGNLFRFLAGLLAEADPESLRRCLIEAGVAVGPNPKVCDDITERLSVARKEIDEAMKLAKSLGRDGEGEGG